MRPESFDSEWANYELQPSFVLGFHGCDAAVGEAILRGDTANLSPSQNDYDWLGHGIYFWEGSPARALQFAQERAQGGRNSKGEISRPFVLGAIINMRRCLDLADSNAIGQVQRAYRVYRNVADATGRELPSNGVDMKMRRLDCAIFNWLHTVREEESLPPYDTIRGLFLEGDGIYPGAGIRQANHIQLCVRNIGCILGYFRPTAPVPA